MREDAKDSLLSYLMKWRIARRETGAGVERGVGGRRSNDSRKIDMVRFLHILSALYRAELKSGAGRTGRRYEIGELTGRSETTNGYKGSPCESE